MLIYRRRNNLHNMKSIPKINFNLTSCCLMIWSIYQKYMIQPNTEQRCLGIDLSEGAATISLLQAQVLRFQIEINCANCTTIRGKTRHRAIINIVKYMAVKIVLLCRIEINISNSFCHLQVVIRRFIPQSKLRLWELNLLCLL